MEIAMIVIAVIGLLALSSSGGGSISGGINVVPASHLPPRPPYEPPQTWQPQPSSSYGPPMVPSTSSNVNGQLFSGAAQIGSQVASKAIQTGTTLTGVGLAATTAGISAAIGFGVALIANLIQGHEARLHGALNENAAIDQYIPVFDSFVKQLVTAYNHKQCTAAQAALAAQRFDQYLYNTFRSFVGAPGTHWDDAVGMEGKCNRTCTAGCCVYFGDLGPVLNNISFVLGFPTGKWGAGDARVHGRTLTVPKVYPSKYSHFSRELYTITLN